MKSWLLFTTPRSGSTPVYHLFAEYFRLTEGLNGVGELFNTSHLSAWMEGGRVVARSFPTRLKLNDKTEYSPGFRDALRKVRRFRRDLLYQSSPRPFFKLFPSDLFSEWDYSYGGETVPWLRENYEWIYLERVDLWEQLLSWMVSAATDLWYQQGGLKIVEGSLTGRRFDFDVFERMTWTYEGCKARVRPKHLIWFEDFCELSPTDFLVRAGFKEKVDVSRAETTERQNPRTKATLFANPDEIRGWYEASFLSKLALRRASERSLGTGPDRLPREKSGEPVTLEERTPEGL